MPLTVLSYCFLQNFILQRKLSWLCFYMKASSAPWVRWSVCALLLYCVYRMWIYLIDAPWRCICEKQMSQNFIHLKPLSCLTLAALCKCFQSAWSLSNWVLLLWLDETSVSNAAMWASQSSRSFWITWGHTQDTQCDSRPREITQQSTTISSGNTLTFF